MTGPSLKQYLFTFVLASLGLSSSAQAAPEAPLFSRHVVPLFSRLGCNAGSCHGAVKGQNGFRLSLFGADPALDHDRLLHEFSGRRLNLLVPQESLLLQKATGQVAHQGGKLISVDGPEYRTLLAWITRGATLDEVSRSRPVRLTVTPTNNTVKTGESYPLRVEATFADDSREDATGLCSFESVDRHVATVDRKGTVHAVGKGDAALLIRYRGQPVLAQVVVSAPATVAVKFPEVNFIDKQVAEKLHRMNLQPSELSDDAVFLRRVYLDGTGALPKPEEVRAFLADKREDKRARLIETLLERPGHAALWATRFCDILRPSGFDAKAGLVEAAEARRFYDWLRARLSENTPYDQLAERILLATSREGRSDEDWLKEARSLAEENASKTHEMKAYASRKTLDLFWQRTGSSGVKNAVRVGHAFLGLRLECAQCHRHPHDVWQQDDLLSFANFFTRTGSSGSTASAEATRATESLAGEIKKLKDEGKKQTDKAKESGLSKEDKAKAQAEAKVLADKAKALEDVVKRLKTAEVHTAGKATPASVSSTLGTQKSERYRLLGKEDVKPPVEGDPRAVVMAWMRQPDNPFFARALVNRVWAHYFGRGIIDPPDQLSPLNPASHPELLKELSDGFIKNRFDLRWLHRTILNSRTYQLSAQTNAGNRKDTRNYASFYLRRLPAELLVDAVNHATGGSETFPDELRLPPGALALEVAGATGSEKSAASLQYPFMIFGRPMRSLEAQCDCERDSTPTIVQTLYLTNHPRMRDKLSSPTGRVARIVKDLTDETKRIEEVFLWTVSRLPTEAEREACIKYVRESVSPQRGLEDVMWGLLNTHEFLLQH